MQCNHVALAARTAGTICLALLLALVPAATAPASGATQHADRILIPSAGWNGRPIQQPHRHDVVRTSNTDRPIAGWSAGPVAFGTGFHHPGGSARVREVQRRLSRLGYHVGPIDGLFGRRTRAATAWFQVKHGLEVDGRATLDTVRHLRARSGSGGHHVTASPDPEAASHQASAAPRSEAWEAFNQLVGPRPAPGDGTGVHQGARWGETVLGVLVAGIVLLLVALLLQRRSRGTDDIPGPAAHAHVAVPEPAGEPQPDPVRQESPSRRFSPPEPAVEPRPPGHVRVSTRHDESVHRHE